MKNLYIFDFDETLVTCDSYIYVLNDKQERIRKLDAHEYFVRGTPGVARLVNHHRLESLEIGKMTPSNNRIGGPQAASA